MRVLVTWGSKRGGTEGIGQLIAETLESRGYDVVAVSAEDVRDLESFDAVVVGGALYMNRWPANARRFVRRNVKQLRKVPVWFFSSGPLDDSADRGETVVPERVDALAERVGAINVVTFGGRLEDDASGFPASAMAEESAGDWRNPERIRKWATHLAGILPTAPRGHAIDHAGHSLLRVVAHAVAGWAVVAAALFALLNGVSAGWAMGLHALAVTVVFGLLAWYYFDARGSRVPLWVALTWTGIFLVGHVVVVAWIAQGSLALLTSIAGLWLPVALVFGVTWGVGAIMATLPWSTDTAKEVKTPA